MIDSLWLLRAAVFGAVIGIAVLGVFQVGARGDD